MLNNSDQKAFVFVPSYNHSRFIERCLRSIIEQTLPPAKLLVIDDGSKDDSVRVIERVLQDCPFPSELIARPNAGLCRTLNQGFEQSAGEYFAYLGSDDMWLPEFLERRVALMQQNPNAVLGYGNAFLTDDNDNRLQNSADWAENKIGDTRKMLLLGISPVSSTVFYRRSALEKVRWNEDSKLEDYEFYLKLSTIGEFVFDPNVYSTWRQHGSNASADLSFLLAEVLAALERNREVLRLSKSELRQAKRAVGFRYSEYNVRRGFKRESFRLALKNWRGAADALTMTKVALLLLLPPQFFDQFRKLSGRKNA